MQAPVLLEDGSSLDWPAASYSPKVRIGGQLASVSHRLDAATGLADLVAEGDLLWAVELRCPKTLLARIETSRTAEQTVRWEPGEIDGQAWLLPGLLSPQELQLSDRAELNELWRDAAPRFPSGWWAARGDARRIEPLAESLLSFYPDEELDAGRIEVEPDRSTGNLRFKVRAAPDVIRQADTKDRTLWIAALIGVCGHFRREFGSEEDDDGEGGGGELADELRFRLEEAGVLTWDVDQYDPAAAGTAIEPFVFDLEEGTEADG